MTAIPIPSESLGPLNSQFYQNNAYENSIEQLNVNGLKRYSLKRNIYVLPPMYSIKYKKSLSVWWTSYLLFPAWFWHYFFITGRCRRLKFGTHSYLIIWRHMLLTVISFTRPKVNLMRAFLYQIMLLVKCSCNPQVIFFIATKINKSYRMLIHFGCTIMYTIFCVLQMWLFVKQLRKPSH